VADDARPEHDGTGLEGAEQDGAEHEDAEQDGAQRSPSPLRAFVGQGLHQLPGKAHALLPPEQRADLRHWLGRYHANELGHPLVPPPPGPGEVVGPPDFVGIGTRHSGAAWWYRLVTAHPGVYARPDMAMGRDYLTHFATTQFGDPEVSRYHGWFPRRSGTITGEWSPGYMASAWVPALLAIAAPEARLLVMVRDPVERLRIDLDQRTEGQVSHIGSHIGGAVDRGYYAAQLRRVLEHFPSEQVLVLQTERCLADPADSLASTYRFLGVDDGFVPSAARVPDRLTSAPSTGIDADTAGRLAELYAADVADLESLVPGFERSRWPEFA
jgi:hypothetical protein